MIRSLFLDTLDRGQLPMYERENDGHIFVFHQDGTSHSWDSRHDYQEAPFRDGPPRQLPPRVRLDMSIDTHLEEFEDNLREWLKFPQQAPGEGTLIFAFHRGSLNPEDDHWGYVGTAGLAYFSPSIPEYPFDITGYDPVNLILDWCRERPSEHPDIRRDLEWRRLARAEQHQFFERERQEAEAALARSLRLLQGCLTSEQREELEAKKHFHVRAQNGALFRIDAKRHQNIFEVENGKEVRQYCIVIRDAEIPLYDQLLAQKFMVEASLGDFMKISNKWDLTRQRTRIPGIDHLLNRAFTERELDQLDQFIIEPTPPT